MKRMNYLFFLTLGQTLKVSAAMFQIKSFSNSRDKSIKEILNNDVSSVGPRQ
jgi:hypothetical protein